MADFRNLKTDLVLSVEPGSGIINKLKSDLKNSTLINSAVLTKSDLPIIEDAFRNSDFVIFSDYNRMLASVALEVEDMLGFEKRARSIRVNVNV